MGMGEPLANYDPVWASVERLHGDLGLSARRITISTVGVVPGMRRLAQESLPVTLAVSLHAPDDRLRNELVPLNRRYPLDEVLDAAAEVAGAHGRRVTFEYAGIAGVNDRAGRPKRSDRLSSWQGVGGPHVNLIPLNPTSGYKGRTPPGPTARVRRRLRRRACRPRSGATAVSTSTRRAASSGPGQIGVTSAPADPLDLTAVGQNGAVNEWRFLNQYQPQTLVIGTMLCYLDAIFGLLGLLAAACSCSRPWPRPRRLRHREREALGLRPRGRRRDPAGAGALRVRPAATCSASRSSST